MSKYFAKYLPIEGEIKKEGGDWITDGKNICKGVSFWYILIFVVDYILICLLSIWILIFMVRWMLIINLIIIL